MDAEKMKDEARAKIIWGETAESVVAYLQAQGLGDKEALALVVTLQRERAASIRMS